MTQELWHTSAPRGLKPGTRGFCTVVSTQGMPVNLAERLELLSGYRHLEAPRPDGSDANPVAWNHVRLVVGGRRLHVLSRIASAGLDYSGRSNKFAHHVVLEQGELPAAGPAWLVAQPGFLETSWDGQLRLLPKGRSVPQGDVQPSPCRAWERVAGDAGWAGRLAETVLESAGKGPRTVYIIVPRGLDVLALFAEAVALLPAKRRWDATFSTFYLPLPGDVDCRWRAVYEDTPEVQAARRQRGAWCLDLTGPLPALEETPAVVAARQGKPIVPEPLPSVELRRSASLASLAVDSLEARPDGPPMLAPPPLTVPPPLVGRWAASAEPRHGRRRRWLLAALATLAVLLLLGVGAAVLWGPAGGRDWLGGAIALVRSQGSGPQSQDDGTPPGPPTPPKPQAPDGQSAKPVPAASGAKPPSPPGPKSPTGRDLPPGQKGNPPPPPNASKPRPDSQTSSKPDQKAQHNNHHNGQPKPPGKADKPAAPTEQSHPGAPAEAVRWCRVVAKQVEPGRSKVQGRSQGSGMVVFELAEGESVEKIELKSLSGSQGALIATAETPQRNAWKIRPACASEVGSEKPLGEFRLESRQVRVVCPPGSGNELATRLDDHLAVVHLKKDGNTASPIAFQFFPSIQTGPLRLTPGTPARFVVPIEGSSKLAVPQFDMDTLQLAVEPEESFVISKVEGGLEPFAPQAPPQSASQYLLDIRPPSGQSGQEAQNQASFRAILRLGWRLTPKKKLEIAFEFCLSGGGKPSPAGLTGVVALIVKKARIFLEVEGYRVDLVEVGTNPAAKLAPSTSGKKNNQRKKGQKR